jgi:hypothetical protein
LSITFPVARNAVKPPGLSEITVGVRNMGILRYGAPRLVNNFFKTFSCSSSCPFISYLWRVQDGNLLNWDDKQALQQQAINMYYKAQLSR